MILILIILILILILSTQTQRDAYEAMLLFLDNPEYKPWKLGNQ